MTTDKTNKGYATPYTACGDPSGDFYYRTIDKAEEGDMVAISLYDGYWVVAEIARTINDPLGFLAVYPNGDKNDPKTIFLFDTDVDQIVFLERI